MLTDLVKNIAADTGLSQSKARMALGIVLNAAERQGSELARRVYQDMPGARTLSARAGADIGAATGLLARMIEQTPGGRQHVAEQMIRDLQREGLGHAEIGGLLPSIGRFLNANCDPEMTVHLGALFGSGAGAAAAVEATRNAA